MTMDRATKTEPFVYERSDLAALTKQLVKWWRWLPLAAVVVFFLYLSGIFSWRHDETEWFFVALAGLMATLSLISWGVRPALAYRSLRREGLIVPQFFEVGEDAFSMHSARADIRLQWTAVVKISRIRDRLFVFATRKIAYVVPRRAFVSNEEFDAFTAAAQERWAAALHDQPRNPAKSVSVE
jgi:hypothetical protein